MKAPAFRTYSMTLASSPYAVEGLANFFALTKATHPVYVRFDGGPELKIREGFSIRGRDDAWGRVEVRHEYSSTIGGNPVEFVCGLGSFDLMPTPERSAAVILSNLEISATSTPAAVLTASYAGSMRACEVKADPRNAHEIQLYTSDSPAGPEDSFMLFPGDTFIYKGSSPLYALEGAALGFGSLTHPVIHLAAYT